jgi:hypothetical protein
VLPEVVTNEPPELVRVTGKRPLKITLSSLPSIINAGSLGMTTSELLDITVESCELILYVGSMVDIMLDPFHGADITLFARVWPIVISGAND